LALTRLLPFLNQNTLGGRRERRDRASILLMAVLGNLAWSCPKLVSLPYDRALAGAQSIFLNLTGGRLGQFG